MRKGLLAWQWADYGARHRSRTNLLVHAIAVPVFQVGCVAIIAGALLRSPILFAAGTASLVASLVAQGRGHRSEAETHVPFDGPLDFITRFLAEQWITFPRFVLSGAWWRAITAPAAPRPLQSE